MAPAPARAPAGFSMALVAFPAPPEGCRIRRDQGAGPGNAGTQHGASLCCRRSGDPRAGIQRDNGRGEVWEDGKHKIQTWKKNPNKPGKAVKDRNGKLIQLQLKSLRTPTPQQRIPGSNPTPACSGNTFNNSGSAPRSGAAESSRLPGEFGGKAQTGWDRGAPIPSHSRVAPGFGSCCPFQAHGIAAVEIRECRRG